jgi:hypothetical protein
MKRFLSLTLFVVVILAVCFLLLKYKSQFNPTVVQSERVQSPSENLKTNDVKIIVAEPQAIAPTTTEANNSPSAILNANAENIEEWKAAITNLHYDPAIKGNWTAWQGATNPGISLVIGTTNKNLVEFDSELINIYTRRDNSENIHRVELHSVWMNIADTKLLGDSLLEMMGKDKTSFDAWCDKVGNNWVDAPLYDSYNARLPNSDKVYSFGTHITFNNERPWFIYFVIADP